VTLDRVTLFWQTRRPARLPLAPGAVPAEDAGIFQKAF